MNAPENFEINRIPDGKSKVEVQELENVLNCSLFTIYIEDHTLGNMVQNMLLRNKNVLFAGYRKPHPLENKIEIKIQTNDQISPSEAFKDALKNLMLDVDDCIKDIEENFEKLEL